MADDAPAQPQRPVQAAALARMARRLSLAGEAPWLHTEVATRMAQRLGVVRLQPRALIDWWSCNGGSHQLLRQTYPQARVQRVEAVDRLHPHGLAEPLARWWSPRRWSASSVTTATEDQVAAGGAELLWANMMLHLVDDPQALMRQWQRALAVDGFLMFSTLGPGSLAGLRRVYAQMRWPAPHAAFVDMHDLGDMLAHAGFADPVMDQEILTLTWADAPALLRELRTLGANADPQRYPGLRTPRWRDALLAALADLQGPDGRLRLEFEVVYGHAFRVAPRPRVAAQTTVALEEMRAMVRSSRRSS